MSDSGRVVRAFSDIKSDLIENMFYMGYKNEALKLTAAEKKHNKVLAESFFNKYHKLFPEHYRTLPLRERHERITPLLLRGSPGQGKTAVFHEAARQYCKLTSMNLVVNPADNYHTKSHPNDFVMVVLELAAKQTAVDMAGIPHKREYTSVKQEHVEEYMSMLKNVRFAALQKSIQGLLVLDDFSSAFDLVQTACHGLIKDGMTQDGTDIGNTLVGLTGNLGEEDYTNSFETPSSIIGRVFPYEVMVDYEGWKRWFMSQDKGDVTTGDAGILGFLDKFNGEFFNMEPSQETGYGSPRTWTQVIHRVSDFMYLNGYAFQLDSVMVQADRQLRDIVNSGVGSKAGMQLSSYLSSLYSSAAPLADVFFAKGEFSDKESKLFKKRFADGKSRDGRLFGFQFGDVMVSNMINHLRKNAMSKSSKEVNRFLDGLTMITDDAISMNFKKFADRANASLTGFDMDDYNDKTSQIFLLNELIKAHPANKEKNLHFYFTEHISEFSEQKESSVDLGKGLS